MRKKFISIFLSLILATIPVGQAKAMNFGGDELKKAAIVVSGIGALIGCGYLANKYSASDKLVQIKQIRERINPVQSVRSQVNDRLTKFAIWRIKPVQGGYWQYAYQLVQDKQNVIDALYYDIQTDNIHLNGQVNLVCGVFNGAYQPDIVSLRQVLNAIEQEALAYETNLSELSKMFFDEEQNEDDIDENEFEYALIQRAKNLDPEISDLTSLYKLNVDQLEILKVEFIDGLTKNRSFLKRTKAYVKALDAFWNVACAYSRVNTLKEIVRENLAQRERTLALGRDVRMDQNDFTAFGNELAARLRENRVTAADVQQINRLYRSACQLLRARWTNPTQNQQRVLSALDTMESDINTLTGIPAVERSQNPALAFIRKLNNQYQLMVQLIN